MSRTYKGSKGAGFEFWKSRYSPGGDGKGRSDKILTHRRERRKVKNLIDKDSENIYLLRY